MKPSDPVVEILNSLLRGELSAIETFSHVIHKFPESGTVFSLKTMRDDHQDSVAALRSLISMRGGDPDTDSGPWGDFAKAFEGVAALLGSGPAISALKQGEEHGIREYEEAIDHRDLSADIKEVLLRDLLPRLQSHAASLEGLTT